MGFAFCLRRAGGLVAGALIGLAGAAAVAAPVSAHTGDLTAASKCLVEGWTAKWTLATAHSGGHDAVLSDVKVELDHLVAPPGRNYEPRLAEFADGVTITGDTAVTDTLELSPDVVAAALSFTVTWEVGDDVHTKTLTAQASAPADCKWPPRGVQSSYSASFDCASMTVTLVNPAGLRYDAALRLRTSAGEERILDARPGETASEKFAATAGFTVDVTTAGGPQPPGGERPRRLTYERPEGCTTGGGGEAAGDGPAGGDTAGDGSPAGGGAAAGGGEEGGLPVTGAAAGTVAGVAGALLAIGVVLFAVARRRRVKFTA